MNKWLIAFTLNCSWVGGEVINEALMLKIGKLNRCVSVMWSKKPHFHSLLFIFIWINESNCVCMWYPSGKYETYTHACTLAYSRRKSAKIMKNKKKRNYEQIQWLMLQHHGHCWLNCKPHYKFLLSFLSLAPLPLIWFVT